MKTPPAISAREAALVLARRLQAAGHQALFAGGCVRDRLLDHPPKDYDIATSALPAQVIRLFPGSNEVGAHFGVVIAKHGGHHVEIATFRTDGSYRDGRRPETVTFSTPQDDAQRRDFTINGLFETPETGEVIDYVGGLTDLKAGVIRAIGDPVARFTEDGLRLLRAVRFATTLGFTIEPDTDQAIRQCANLLDRISPERIRDEFSKILTSPRRRAGVEHLVDTGLIRHFMPEVLSMIGCDQPPEWHPEGDVYTHTLIMLDMLAPDASLELCLAALLHDIAKPACRTLDDVSDRIRFNGHDSMGAEITESILRRLRYPNDTVATVVLMVARHMQFMNVQKMRVAKLKRFMAAPTFTGEMELHRVDCASSNGFTDNYEFLQAKAAEFAAQPLIPPPLVTGRDLIRLGLQPGPRFKEFLEAVQTEQLEGRITDRQSALEFLLAQNWHYPHHFSELSRQQGPAATLTPGAVGSSVTPESSSNINPGTPPDMWNELDVVRDVSRRLDAAGLPFMLTGSMAMNYYAQPRMTRDIDLVVALDAADASRITGSFAPDYHVSPEAIRDAITHESMFNLIHEESVIKVDLIVRKHSPYRLAEFARRQRIHIEDFSTWIASKEDLIISKLDWAKDSRSSQQFSDVRNLVSTGCDIAYIDHWTDVLGLANLWSEIQS